MPPVTLSSSASNSSSSSSSSSRRSSNNNIWSDLPRRLATIAIGLPIVAILLSNEFTASLFFQFLHILACIEWINLEKNIFFRHRREEQQEGNTKNNFYSGALSSYILSTVIYCFMNWILAKNDLPQFCILISCAFLFLLSYTSSSSQHSSQDSLSKPVVQVSSKQQKQQQPFGGDVPNSKSNGSNSSSSSSSSCSSSRKNQNLKFFLCMSAQHAIFGILFITIPFTSWYKVCQYPQITAHILWIVWNCDNGALLFGRLYASRKQQRHLYKQPSWLIEISPKKSIQGLIGALFLGFVAHILWNYYLGTYLFPSLQQTMVAVPVTPNALPILSHVQAIIICLLAILGDILESAIKRSCHAKDTDFNNIQYLPGHGGIIDRFDSSFLVVVYYYTYIFQTK